jgi:chromosome segregation ATPase
LSHPETIRTKNQRLPIELGNSESEKESLKQQVQELRSQFETERADREEIEAELSEQKQNSAPAATLSDKLTPDATTILSQLARQTQKIKNRPGGLGSHLRDFGKLRRQNFTVIA